MADDPRNEIKQLLSDGDLRSLLIRAGALHGHYCPGLAFGVKAAHTALSRLGFENTGMEELVAVVECNNCFADGLQMASGCTFGNSALVFRDLGKTAVTLMSRRTKSAVRVVLRPRNWDSGDATEREREGRELFQRVVVERLDDPEASKRMRELWTEFSFETIKKSEEDLFDVREVPATFPEYAPIFESAVCSLCCEQFMETRGRLLDGKIVCLTCAGTDCYEVAGRGIHLVPGETRR